MPFAKTLFWGALGALAWTHVGYPVAAGLAARMRSRPVRRRDWQPRATVVEASEATTTSSRADG